MAGENRLPYPLLKYQLAGGTACPPPTIHFTLWLQVAHRIGGAGGLLKDQLVGESGAHYRLFGEGPKMCKLLLGGSLQRFLDDTA